MKILETLILSYVTVTSTILINVFVVGNIKEENTVLTSHIYQSHNKIKSTPINIPKSNHHLLNDMNILRNFIDYYQFTLFTYNR